MPSPPGRPPHAPYTPAATSSELRRARADLHAVLARAHARRRVHARADVDDAHAADADRVVALVVAQHRDLGAHVLRRLPDRRALGHGDVLAVDREADGLDLGWGGREDGSGFSSVSSRWDGWESRKRARDSTGSPDEYPEPQILHLIPGQKTRRVQAAALVVLLDHGIQA